MNRTTAGIAIAAALVGVGVSACVPTTNRAVPSNESARSAPASTSKAPREVNPLTDDGTWLVPSEVKPGTYRAIPTKNFAGYVEVCADSMCKIGDGLIKNYLVSSPEIVSVPDNAYSVKLQRVTLTPLA